MDHIQQNVHRHLRHTRREAVLDTLNLAPRSPLDPVTSSATTLMEKATRVLVARSSCTGDANKCEKPTSSNALPIALSVVVPIAIAIVILIFLHRRHTRKLKQEDLDDKHKSLDFGMENKSGGKKGGKVPEMTITDAEKSIRRGRGLSMDMDMGSPYILPAGLHSSRESFHSMSRSMQDPNDPYRPVTFIKDDSSSSRRLRNDGSSFRTGSSGTTDRMNGSLLKNASRMSQSYPLRGESLSPQDTKHPEIQFPEPAAVRSPSPLGLKRVSEEAAPTPVKGLAPAPTDASRDSYFDKNAKDLRKSNDYLGSFINTLESAPAAPEKTQSPPQVAPSVQEKSASPPAPVPVLPAALPRIQSQTAVVQEPNTSSFISTSSYGDGFKVTPPSPPRNPDIHAPIPKRSSRASIVDSAPVAEEQPFRPTGLAVDDLGFDARRLSVSVRPLPLDDPQENPEERANRIRSFYKEYFDDSRPDPVMSHYGDYYEDYGSEYLADGAVFDPASGQFVVAKAPYAEPVTRRAMTPPPRAPPRFRGAPGPGGRARAGSNLSSASHLMPPRGMSSMSGRMGPPGPRKPVLPPAPLHSLPTPSKLKEDSAIFNAADFAPPLSYRDRQAGRRPESPLGSPRPYSPSVRPHTPLASAFDELSAMPSPHMLRKSGTFTGLEFAPPPRLRDPSGGSDAGSIRSNRSGVSNVAMHSIRAGAYRVSRIPKEVAGTRDDILASLKPQMDMISKA